MYKRGSNIATAYISVNVVSHPAKCCIYHKNRKAKSFLKRMSQNMAEQKVKQNNELITITVQYV